MPGSAGEPEGLMMCWTTSRRDPRALPGPRLSPCHLNGPRVNGTGPRHERPRHPCRGWLRSASRRRVSGLMPGSVRVRPGARRGDPRLPCFIMTLRPGTALVKSHRSYRQLYGFADFASRTRCTAFQTETYPRDPIARLSPPDHTEFASLRSSETSSMLAPDLLEDSRCWYRYSRNALQYVN